MINALEKIPEGRIDEEILDPIVRMALDASRASNLHSKRRSEDEDWLEKYASMLEKTRALKMTYPNQILNSGSRNWRQLREEERIIIQLGEYRPLGCNEFNNPRFPPID